MRELRRARNVALDGGHPERVEQGQRLRLVQRARARQVLRPLWRDPLLGCRGRLPSEVSGERVGAAFRGPEGRYACIGE